jgi:hypothetical protein
LQRQQRRRRRQQQQQQQLVVAAAAAAAPPPPPPLPLLQPPLVPVDYPEFRCIHVNFLDNAQIPGEKEYLFTPCSVFTVLSVHLLARPSAANPDVMRIEAAMDNMGKSQRICPWRPGIDRTAEVF